MAQVNVIGRITADLELKTSEKSNPYVRFDIAENIGSRQTLHTQYFQVCAWGEDANRLMKAHAKKGSLTVNLFTQIGQAPKSRKRRKVFACKKRPSSMNWIF